MEFQAELIFGLIENADSITKQLSATLEKQINII